MVDQSRAGSNYNQMKNPGKFEEILDNHVTDYGTPAECKISVDGTEVKADIHTVRLDQFVDAHHILTVHIRHVGVSSDSVEFDDPSKFTAFLGKPISLDINPHGDIVDSSRALKFIGLVTEVKLDNGINGINTIVVTAHSPTVALDGHQRNKVFGAGQDCSGIAGQILSEYQITQGRIDGAPVATASGSLNLEIDSGVQYRETDYAYIKRLASEHQMFAFYDGTAFNIEKAKGNSEEELVWRQTLGSFALGLGTAPTKFYGRVWDPKKKEVIQSDSDRSSIRAALSDISRVSPESSEDIYTVTGVSSAPKHADQAKSDAAVIRETESSAGRMIVCNGVSIVPAIMIGSCVKISGLDKLDGQYWVQTISHRLDDAGKYYNSFQCTPLELAMPELKREEQPFSHLMTGIVTDNEDPEDLGRIKVKLPWHRDEETQFMRILTPDGGSERGWFGLPEIDDEVLVGYERGNPDMPVILGCLYNGQDKPPIPSSEALNNKAVETKVFRTRNGNEIRFDDADGSEKITISQKDSTNTIVLNMDGPSIAIETTGDISMKGANINLEATSGDIKIKAGANIKAEASANMELKGSADFKSEGGMNYEAKGGISYKASGTQANLEGSAMTTIKGGIVKIN
ncbi:MAG: hypothetical protein DRP47_03970 [Candidatus Zixiibacteriota bacterium]|nr:MAG: hypothetical protein DRP47_03970 [candidate division Zixibacteria bacterium]